MTTSGRISGDFLRLLSTFALTAASITPLGSAYDATPLRGESMHEPWNSLRSVTSIMTSRMPSSRKSLTCRSAFFIPRLCGTFLRSVVYPAWLNSRCKAVRMCSCAPVVAPACCVRGGDCRTVKSKAIARACVVFELEQVRDGQSQLLAVPRYPESLSPCCRSVFCILCSVIGHGR